MIHMQVAPEAAGEAPAIQTALETGTAVQQPIRAPIMKQVGDDAATRTGTAATAITERTVNGEKRADEIGTFSSAGTVSIEVPPNVQLGVAGRIEEPEAVATGAAEVVSNCPFCIQMFEDGAPAIQPEEAGRIRPFDVAELLERAVLGDPAADGANGTKEAAEA